MELPVATVAVFEESRTRADLYALWLDDCEVRTASTTGEVDGMLDGRVTAAVVSEGFGDGAAESVLDRIRERAPMCRVVATRDRSSPFPALNADQQLVKPVFEDALTDVIETLLCRANYHLALSYYYQTTIDLSTFEITDGDADTRSDGYEDLKQRASRLQGFIAKLTRAMDAEDIEAVKRDVTFAGEFSPEEHAEKVDSKYRPGKCSKCGQSWDRASGGDEHVRKLGAYVWRCVDCGHVQMRADPSHRDVGTYRR